MTPRDARAYECACDGLILAIVTAAMWDGQGAIDGYLPYYGRPDDVAAWYAKHTLRAARSFGLYPTTAQLEQEARRAA